MFILIKMKGLKIIRIKQLCEKHEKHYLTTLFKNII